MPADASFSIMCVKNAVNLVCEILISDFPSGQTTACISANDLCALSAVSYQLLNAFEKAKQNLLSFVEIKVNNLYADIKFFLLFSTNILGPERKNNHKPSY